MKSNWKTVKLGDVCEIKYGKDHKKLKDGTVPVYGSGGIMRYVNTELHSKKSVLIPRKGTLNNLFFVKEAFWTVDTLFWTNIYTNKIQPEFLYYQLKTKDLASYNVGTAVPSLTTSVLNEIEINIPSLPEQKTIASILSALDDKIELNNRINKNLEEMARAIFKSWFVDFEPFQNGEFEESELGEIPKGWKIELLGNIVSSVDNRGKTPPLSKGKTQYPIIDVKALSGSQRIIDYNKCTKFVNYDTYTTWFRNGHPQKYDILISTVGSLAEMKLFLGSVGCIAQNVVGFRCNRVSPLYLYQYLCNIKNDIVSYNIGSVQPSIKVTHILKHRILIPNDKILKRFHYYLDTITRTIYNNCSENTRLFKLRDTLLPKLMSGEIDVSKVTI